MKLKLLIQRQDDLSGIVSCIDWTGSNEIFSIGGQNIYKWDVRTRDFVNFARLPDDFNATDMHYMQSKNSSAGKGDSLLIGSASGNFIIINRGARVEKNINAHQYAIATVRWSPDGATLLTAAEDGLIKLWSRTGMLRSTVSQNDEPIRCVRWSPNSTSIVFTFNNFLIIKPLAANSQMIKWRAHEGFVTCICWSPDGNSILSGGEDNKYKLWDIQGNNLFSSGFEEHAITSVQFSHAGDMFVVGSFNLLKLCHANGWTYHSYRFTDTVIGSLFTLTWSQDGNQIVGGTSTGNVIFGSVIEKELIRQNLKATSISRRAIKLMDLNSRAIDILDFPDTIVQWDLGYGHLVVATVNQILIYNENYLNTPIIIDGRIDVKIVSVGQKYFLAVDNTSIWIYNYSGRLHLNPKYPGSQGQIPNLSAKQISVGLDFLAVFDLTNRTNIHLFDMQLSGTRQTSSTPIPIKHPLIELKSSGAGSIDDQYLAYIDIHKDLYIISAHNSVDFAAIRIESQVNSIMWCTEANILVGLLDAAYNVWYCPGEAANDPILLQLATIQFDTSEFGKHVSLESFDGNTLTFLASGALYPILINVNCIPLQRCVFDNMWQKALRICRIANNVAVWATLAAFAIKHNQLEISKEAFTAALQIDKVNYLENIQELSDSSPEHNAETAVLYGRISEAETVLITNKKYSEVIKLCLRMHKWEKALELANRFKTDVDLVLSERIKFLKSINRNETNKKFLQSVNTDDDKIE